MRLLCAVLSIAALAWADGSSKPVIGAHAAGTISDAGFTAWQPVFLMRDGVVNTMKRKEFNDTRFEYRWKSELSEVSPVCTIEIRVAKDADYTDTIPQLSLAYWDRHHHGQRYTARDLAVGGRLEQISFKRTDCETVELVWWNK